MLASIKMPTGNVIFGQPGKDQEEAAENAATEVLNLLRKVNSRYKTYNNLLIHHFLKNRVKLRIIRQPKNLL